MPFADTELINNSQRLNALHRLMLLDSPTEQAFDRLTQLASRILKVPVSLVSLVDSDRQFFKSQIGLPEPWASRRQTPLSHSFCQHVVATGAPLIIDDAHQHPLVHDNLAIEDLNAVAYLGMPLKTSDGFSLGSYCVLDSHAREWSEEDQAILKELAALVMTEIELRSELIERKKAQEQLQKQNEFIEQVTAAVPDIIYIYDIHDGHIELLNRSITELLGYPETKLTQAGSNFLAEMLHPDDLRRQTDIFVRLTEGNASIVEDESRLKHANGEWRWFLRREAVFSRSADGKPQQVLGIAHDITEQKKALALTQQLATEKERVALLSNFIHDTSHDFRTPITIIQSSVELLKRIPDREKQLERITKIERYLNYLVLLLDQHQYMAKLDSTLSLTPSPADINSVISATVENARSRATNKALSFDTKLETGIPKIPVDVETLSHALNNLLDNAITFTPEGGTITTTTQQVDQNVVIEIHDTGKGISDEDLPHVFERLYKGDKARGLGSGGAGLGLSIVKRIFQLHHGTVEIDSKEGEGTTVRLLLPMS